MSFWILDFQVFARTFYQVGRRMLPLGSRSRQFNQLFWFGETVSVYAVVTQMQVDRFDVTWYTMVLPDYNYPLNLQFKLVAIYLLYPFLV